MICNRCGQCCYHDVDNHNIRCKHLVILSNGKTLCRTYNTRLGKVIYKHNNIKYMCIERQELKKDFKGCPYNKKRKKLD